MPKPWCLFIPPYSIIGMLLILLGNGWTMAFADSGNTGAFKPASVPRQQAWQNLLLDLRKQPELQQLQQVNRFFNEHIRYTEDAELWNVSDYWASPRETLEQGAGDCEDFALAKYFTLRELGVPTEHLRLIYTTLAYNGQAHMVLAYWPTVGSNVMILDNLNTEVTPLTRRPDLHIQFAFDSKYVYKYERGNLQAVSTAEILPFWHALLHRVESPRQSLAYLQHGGF